MGHRWGNYKPFDEQAVVEDYKNFVCLTHLSKKYKIGYERIRNCLIKHNVLIASKHEFYKIANERKYNFEDELINDYIGGLTIIKILRKYRIGKEKVHNILIRRNVEIRKASKATTLAWRNGNKKCLLFNKTGTKNIFGAVIQRWKGNAKSRKYEFGLTKEYLQELYEKQEGLCAYTGFKMVSPVTYKENIESRNSPYIISLDRINSDIGYIEGNVQFICWWVNRAKGAMPHDKFQKIIDDLRIHFIENQSAKAV